MCFQDKRKTKEFQINYFCLILLITPNYSLLQIFAQLQVATKVVMLPLKIHCLANNL